MNRQPRDRFISEIEAAALFDMAPLELETAIKKHESKIIYRFKTPTSKQYLLSSFSQKIIKSYWIKKNRVNPEFVTRVVANKDKGPVMQIALSSLSPFAQIRYWRIEAIKGNLAALENINELVREALTGE